MPVQNAEIARIFERVADLLEIQGANPFRVRAYRTAAQTAQSMPHALHELHARGENLARLPGIGKDLAGKIAEIVETGALGLLDDIALQTPPEVADLLSVPGLPDEVLADLDVTVCSVHTSLELSRNRQTERILRAMDHPGFHVLGHPTGRLLNRRAPFEVDVERLVEGASERGCCLELNAQPKRLDLPDVWCRAAKEAGVKLAISTDAHTTDQLDWMGQGVGYARRGWIEAGDVLNTRPWPEAEALLRRG